MPRNGAHINEPETYPEMKGNQVIIETMNDNAINFTQHGNKKKKRLKKGKKEKKTFTQHVNWWCIAPRSTLKSRDFNKQLFKLSKELMKSLLNLK